MTESHDKRPGGSEEPSFLDASEEARTGLFADFIAFMRENAKWWLIPFLFVFLILGIAIALGTTGAAPFIYTMF